MANRNKGGKGVAVTFSDARKMSAMHKSGKTLEEIANWQGVSKRTAANVIKRYRSMTGNPTDDLRVKLTDRQRQDIVDAYNSSRTTTAVLAARYEVSQQYVAKLIKEARGDKDVCSDKGVPDGDHNRVQKTNGRTGGN